MTTFPLEYLYPVCYDEHLYPVKQLAIWQYFLEEMGYNIYIEHKPSAFDNNEVVEENIIYHVVKRDNPDDHYTMAYAREIKKEYGF